MKTKKLILLATITSVVIAGLILANRVRVLQSEAKIPESVGAVSLRATKDSEPGRTKVEVYFRTGISESQKENISMLAFRMRLYGITGIKTSDSETANRIKPDDTLSGNGEWEFPVNEVRNDDGVWTVDFSAANLTTEGYSSVNETLLATFIVESAGALNQLNVEFDEGYAVMYSKKRPVTDIWTGQMTLTLPVLR